MRIIRGQPASGKPPRITCTGCGKRAIEAGIAVPDDAVEQGEGYGPDGPAQFAIVDPDDEQPLCEVCCTTLLRGRANFSPNAA